MPVGLPPLPAETAYWQRAEDRQRVVNGLFDVAATHYDLACTLMSFGSGQRYRREALVRAGLRPGMNVLDVGTGTGLLAREIGRVTGAPHRIVGLDPSSSMLSVYRKAAATSVLVQGIGERLPLADESFDFVTMGYALRHVADLDRAFSEYRRVLKPAGRVLLLEITRPKSTLGLAAARLYFRTLVPLATRIATGSTAAAQLMRFYWDTIQMCVPPESVVASIERVGFVGARHTITFGIFSEYTGVRAS
jgi:demethylmenaquinone methyltransferase / 2-methoxy-6-polyprenyl-1,4-benzoquinol methylase